jgi:arginine-tRNA-protein transferase
MRYRTEEHAVSFEMDLSCPYFDDGRISSVSYLFPGKTEMKNFHRYLERGYRRQGRIFYRNICKDCAACIPLRLETERFSPSRSQKRTMKKNGDVRVEVISPTSVTGEKIILYGRYLGSKHGEKDIRSPLEYESHLAAIHYGYAGTLEMNYYLGDRLIGVGIVDPGEDALSSNYFYYDTDFLTRRLGVFSILEEISLARRLEKKYYYLGFYIEETPKMAYKKFFRPNQVLADGRWKEFLGKHA